MRAAPSSMWMSIALPPFGMLMTIALPPFGMLMSIALPPLWHVDAHRSAPPLAYPQLGSTARLMGCRPHQSQ